MNHRLNILIVEDEKNICDFLGAFLIGQGYQVSFAAKGKEALSLISSNCPDVVLLDLGLPDIDGMDVIESVRTWSSVPIIVMKITAIWLRVTAEKSRPIPVEMMQ